MGNRNLLILGFGQYGTVAKETAEAMGCFDTVSFLDDQNPAALGKLGDYTRFAAEYSDAFVAMGNPVIRGQWLERLKVAGFMLPLLKHPQATVMPSASIGGGSIVEGQAMVHSNTCLAEGCIISAGAVVNHNAVLEPCCHIDCNAVVPAGQRVPAQTKVPCGTVFQRKD